MMNLTRRQALYLGLIPLAISVMPRLVARVLVIGDDSAREWAKSLDCFQRFVHRSWPTESHWAPLFAILFSGKESWRSSRGPSSGTNRLQDARQLRTLLAQKREHDFRNGNIAIVDGWVLSRTEARACALVALL